MEAATVTLVGRATTVQRILTSVMMILVLNILFVMIHLEVIPVLVIQDTSLTTASCVKVT